MDGRRARFGRPGCRTSKRQPSPRSALRGRSRQRRGSDAPLATRFALTALLLALAVPVVEAAEPPWQRLEYRAKKLFLSADATVEFDSSAPLPAVERCGVAAPAPAAAARVRIESAMFGRRSESALWFDPASMRAHLRILEERGRRNRYKRYAFCGGRVESERATPNPGEEGLPVSEWTHRYPLEYPVPSDLEAPLSEPSALLYLVGRLAAAPPEVEPKTSWTVPMFSNNRVLAVRIDRNPQTVAAAPGFTVAAGSLPAQLTLVRFALTPAVLGPDGRAEDFELLGLEGAIEIVAARELQLPVSISGNLPPAGRVTVRLRHVRLR